MTDLKITQDDLNRMQQFYDQDNRTVVYLELFKITVST
jgi:hypothetical protein